MSSDGAGHLAVPKEGEKVRRVFTKKSKESLTTETSNGDTNVSTGILNAYSLNPRTVPPFAVDAIVDPGSDHQHQHHKRDECDQMFKDTFLMSHSDKWSKFLHNAGSNQSYTSRIKLDCSKTKSDGAGAREHSAIVSYSSASSGNSEDEKGTKAHGTEVDEEPYNPLDPSAAVNDKNPKLNTDKNADYYDGNVTDSSYDDEVMRVKQEIFENLDGDWEGGKRLEAIFNAPIPESYELSNQRDKNEWLKYISQLKAFYYLDKDSSKHLSEGNNSSEHPFDDGMLHTLVNKGKSKVNDKKNSWASLEKRKKQQWLPRLRRLLLQSQYLPLSLRFITGVLCIISLALAIRIYQNSHSGVSTVDTTIAQQPSTIMALCVNSIAIVYLVYIGYDEFSGKPLGIRDPMAKVRLIMLDLLFIIFSSANLSLTFNTLYDSQWVCTSSENSQASPPHVGYICDKQRALAAFLFLVLVTWVLTFSISILRVVKKVSSATPRG
ncbi:unnamed protein product [Kluyveromyces dobzhanskii CBS 2104]|uniref:WGS project CCBQ000000000 data, contig 00015 n=1 Tax=Kluyveromyces dobzhanskii CBS 2104 TaxID=1427455 RepID=A0A0A8LBM5_9SACH|nr:unnamed protein product [Kluyveromyces dobzhanskii CBS 2104]